MSILTTPADRMIAAALIEMLDEAGYLPADLDMVRAQLGATPEHFESIIARLQRFDPCGIFARSLHECLALQLFEKDRLDPAMGILLQHLDLLARRENAALMRLCNVDAEDLAEMVAEIRQLNPKPAMAFTSDVAPPIVPDVFLRPQPGGGWHVELNTETLPRVLANERYYIEDPGFGLKKIRQRLHSRSLAASELAGQSHASTRHDDFKGCRRNRAATRRLLRPRRASPEAVDPERHRAVGRNA